MSLSRSTPPTLRHRLRSLLQSAGQPARAPGNRIAALDDHSGFERLEDRVMLASDEPNFNQVFGTGTPLTPPVITLDAQGVGTGATGSGRSTIGTPGDNDVFSFIAPANDFVTVRADALNTGSTLDSRVEVYTGTIGGSATLIIAGSNNGTTTAGTLIDGWVGFVATAGTQYFIVVKSDFPSGPGALGDYILRVDAKSTVFPDLDPASGDASIGGAVTVRGGDTIYKVVTPPGQFFNGVGTVLIQSVSSTDLDPRVDVYSAAGARITGDSDSGNLTDSYLALRTTASTTYYLRVRSDEFLPDSALHPSLGAYTVLFDGIGRNTFVDPVRRLGNTGTRSVATQKDIDFFRFKAQGTGLTFITVNVGIPFGMPDSAVHIYDGTGAQIGFNELTGAFSRIQIQLTGGQTYYVVVENFDGTAGGLYRGEIEAHSTFVASEPVDDHVSTPVYDPANVTDAARRQFELATPIIWSTPQDAQTPPFQGLLPIATPDHSQVLIGSLTGRIHDAGDTDLFQFVPPIDMLGGFAGTPDPRYPGTPPDKTRWQPYYRPATSVQIFVNAETLFNARVRIIDSNFQQIYPNAGTNDNLITGTTDPAGALDPASFPPTLDPNLYGYTFAAGQPVHIDMWGGEVYYLEVSGAGTGRYNGTVQVDAYTDHGVPPPPAPGQPSTSVFGPRVAQAGGWASAREIQINPADGDGRNYGNVAGGAVVPAPPPGPPFTAVPGLPSSGANLTRAYAMNLDQPRPPAPGAGATVGANFIGDPGSVGRVIFQMSDLGIIETPQDTELYQFRAIYTGTAEIRVATTQITDEFFEGMVQTEDGNPMTPPVIEGISRKTKTYNSPLDAALRVFDNDQTEIGYNNDNSVTGGESDNRNVGTQGRTFQRRDPRVVIPVEAGHIYFVQVESGQRQNFNLTFPKVDWRHAIGSFELLINSMPNLNFADDHVNGPAPNAQATPIPLDLSITSTTATLGTVPGEIQNNLSNNNDSDLFNFLAPNHGNARITVSVANGSSFDRTVTVSDVTGTVVGTVVATGTDDAVVTVLAAQGDRFYVNVAGTDLSQQGHYTVSVSGIPAQDDYASDADFFDAKVIDKDLYDFDRTETLPGKIENAGDTDIFSFQSITYDVLRLTVHSLTLNFHPFIRVYEIGEDGNIPVSNPVLMQIGFNSSGVGTDATVQFSVTAPPRTSTTSGSTYNSYFAVVSGVDPNADAGDYTLTLDLNVATDDHPDAGQYTLADPITLTPSQGQFVATGSAAGVIELTGDTDLFTFTSPSQGLASVSVTSPAGSLLLPRVRIFDSAHNPVTSTGGTQFVTGPDQAVSVATFQFTAQRNGIYFIQVEGVTTFTNVFKTADTGAYTVDVGAPTPDDHPNVGEFPIADVVTLSPFSGDSSAAGMLEIPTDSDLFKFVTVANGDVVVTVINPSNSFRPFLRLFDGSTTEIGTAVRDGGPGDEDNQLNGAVTRTIHGTVTGQTYFFLVSSDQTEPINHQTGSYTAILDGNAPPHGTDDHTNAGDYNNATIIPLDIRTGDGLATGNIEIAIDTDLFVFTSLAGSPSRPRQAFVTITTPTGSTLDVGVRIYTLVGGVHQQIASDTGGSLGANAYVTFNIDGANKQYWVEVDGLANTGSYIVSIDTQPNTFFLYYPEGFANANIREYVAIGNANNYDVHYTVRLVYEDSNIPDVTISRTIPAHSRGGETISDGTSNPGSGVTFNKPYAMIVESDGFLGANLSHYDFGNTLGEAFTGRTSDDWSFAKGQKFHGQVNDFLIYYNPNPTDVRVTLTIYQTDPVTHAVTSTAMAQVVQGFHRLGWAFDQTAQIPNGEFAFTVTSAPVNAGDAHIGVVAALSHYDLANSVGYAVLGDPDSGARTGIVPGLISTATAAPLITFFNSSATAATVGLVGKYTGSGLPNLIKNITLAPGEMRSYDATALGLVSNQTIGLRYDANTNVTALAATNKAGDADGTQANTDAGREFFFGDAFINRLKAGTLYFEDMNFYNPDTVGLPVTLTFQFSNGGVSSYTFLVPPKDFAHVALHQLSAILNHAVFNYFSITATAANPFSCTMSHYDLVLAGGWGTKGAPLGPTVPLFSIT